MNPDFYRAPVEPSAALSYLAAAIGLALLFRRPLATLWRIVRPEKPK